MNLVTAVMGEGSLKQANADKDYLEYLQETQRLALLPKMQELFDLIDEDCSGEVTYDEMRDAFIDHPDLKETLRELVGDFDIEDIFLLLDDDGSGTLEVEEFVSGLASMTSNEVVLRRQSAKLA